MVSDNLTLMPEFAMYLIAHEIAFFAGDQRLIWIATKQNCGQREA